ANEAGLPSKMIGAIEVQDRFSIVEVPEPVIDELVSVLHHATIRGRKFPVRRHVDRRPTTPRTKKKAPRRE
ncbi:DbpA RNA binding domain-containing protein, partial [Myxococcota bacterium]|nr:DbpA RNA binding domain-containing protein [Myxococcota bacterium]